jgi:hypothetical protein
MEAVSPVVTASAPAAHAVVDICSAFVRSISVATPTPLLRAELENLAAPARPRCVEPTAEARSPR